MAAPTSPSSTSSTTRGRSSSTGTCSARPAVAPTGATCRRRSTGSRQPPRGDLGPQSSGSGKACDTGGVAPRYACDRSSVMPIDTELEPAELEGRVLEAIELIRPALQSDGGDIVFDNLDDDGVVHVTLVGACGTCPISMQTLKAGVERIIMDRAPGVTAVVDDSLVDDDPFA